MSQSSSEIRFNGQWKTEETAYRIAIRDEFQTIAYVKKSEAHPALFRGYARLIAAAPDLLAVLEAIINGLHLDPRDAEFETIVNQAEDAIEKAKGVANG